MKNLFTQSCAHDIDTESYMRQAAHAADWQFRFLRRAAELGATIVHDAVEFSGTPAQVIKKMQLLLLEDSSWPLKLDVDVVTEKWTGST